MMYEDNGQSTQDMAGGPGLRAEDPISEAGRKIFLYQYQAIRFYETRVRLSQDIEALHKMRVSVRRMRTAYRVFRPYISKDMIRSYIKELRGLGDLLGAVRDLDVFLLNAETYIGELVINDRKSFIPIEAYFKKIRQQHRGNLFMLLNSRTYQDLCEGLIGLLTRSNGLVLEIVDQPTSQQTDFLGREIIRRRYEKILGYDRLSEKEAIEHLHKIRIAVKVFRYSIEFFEEILGSKSREVIDSLITIQDYLGELNDKAVATRLMEDLLAQSSFHNENGDDVIVQATNYLEYLRDDVEIRIENFPSTWEIFHHPAFVSSLEELISG